MYEGLKAETNRKTFSMAKRWWAAGEVGRDWVALGPLGRMDIELMSVGWVYWCFMASVRCGKWEAMYSLTIANIPRALVSFLPYSQISGGLWWAEAGEWSDQIQQSHSLGIPLPKCLAGFFEPSLLWRYQKDYFRMTEPTLWDDIYISCAENFSLVNIQHKATDMLISTHS